MFGMIKISNCTGFFCLYRNSLCHHHAEYELGFGNHPSGNCLGWGGGDLVPLWLAAGESPGDEEPGSGWAFPPEPQQLCTPRCLWGKTPMCCSHLHPSDVFSGWEALWWPSSKLEAEAQTLIHTPLDQAQRK